MLIFAHRGYHAEVPENTLAAFDRAVSLGVDGIETDVRLTSDGTAILFHDRLAPDGRDVSSLSRSELSDLVGYDVPTLETALRRHATVTWNLEIKVPAAVDATLAAVKRFSTSTRFLITSFWHPVVDRVSRAVPDACGLLIAHCPLQVRSLFKATPAGVGTLVWSFETVDPGTLERASALGLRNFVYGPVSRAEHESIRRLGVDGVITDHPEYLLGRSH
ncbi:MAG: glycerophosphodiester phosphodiesterase, partial [Planctomycetia bacterium]|nr:glycerophosphodiester phosphodiesterase [Planctomycetia bacterium]